MITTAKHAGLARLANSYSGRDPSMELAVVTYMRRMGGALPPAGLTANEITGTARIATVANLRRTAVRLGVPFATRMTRGELVSAINRQMGQVPLTIL